MRNEEFLIKQIEKSETVIRIETLILEAAKKELNTLRAVADKKAPKGYKEPKFISGESIHSKYLRLAQSGNYEAEVWIRNELNF